ncbi:unnamed protein product [Knipowitschia caucasica]
MFAFICFSLLGLCLSVEVQQTPLAFITNPGEQIQVFCSHSRGDYTLMRWYQKQPGDLSLKFIGYLSYGNKVYEEAFKQHFTFSGDLSGDRAKNASMSITNIRTEHSAIYYCAASYAH